MLQFVSECGRGRPERQGGSTNVAWLVLLAVALVPARRVGATPPSPAAPSAVAVPAGGEGQEEQPLQPGGYFNGVGRSTSLLGDMGGLRTALSQYGVSLAVSEVSEVLGNVTGGVRRGVDYDGVTTLDLQFDTQRARLFHGGTFNASALQIHGRNLSTEDLLTLQTASGIEADRATRLWELWYQQKFLDEDRLDVKIGQQSLDQEFIVSQNAGIFVNTAFGWPALPTFDLPGGGPAYPLASLGVRVRARPTNALTFLAGAYNGSPARSDVGDPQQNNATGTQFPLNSGPFVIAEAQYTNPSLGIMSYPDDPDPLPATYKLGLWFDSQQAPSGQIDQEGLPIADEPAGSSALHGGTYAFYAVADQLIWRSTSDSSRTVSLFARAMGAPQQDRNLIVFSLNAGMTLHDPFPTRSDDTFGLALAYARLSDAARESDLTIGRFAGMRFPVRSDETVIEATYQFQAAPWCTLQPDVQYNFNPGGGVLNPRTADQRVKNELVVGMRATLLF